MNEIWKDIEGYEGLYQVSNLGNVRSLNYRGLKGCIHILKPQNVRGYLVVPLSKNNTTRQYKIHRLVAQAFIQNLDNKPQVNHRDEDKLNNNVSNLEWNTSKENVNWGTRTERCQKRVACYLKDGTFIAEYDSEKIAAKETNIKIGGINQTCLGYRKSAGGFIWRFI